MTQTFVAGGTLDEGVFYPESDGEPMIESYLQFDYQERDRVERERVAKEKAWVSLREMGLTQIA